MYKKLNYLSQPTNYQAISKNLLLTNYVIVGYKFRSLNRRMKALTNTVMTHTILEQFPPQSWFPRSGWLYLQLLCLFYNVNFTRATHTHNVMLRTQGDRLSKFKIFITFNHLFTQQGYHWSKIQVLLQYCCITSENNKLTLLFILLVLFVCGFLQLKPMY